MNNRHTDASLQDVVDAVQSVDNSISQLDTLLRETNSTLDKIAASLVELNNKDY